MLVELEWPEHNTRIKHQQIIHFNFNFIPKGGFHSKATELVWVLQRTFQWSVLKRAIFKNILII